MTPLALSIDNENLDASETGFARESMDYDTMSVATDTGYGDNFTYQLAWYEAEPSDLSIRSPFSDSWFSSLRISVKMITSHLS